MPAFPSPLGPYTLQSELGRGGFAVVYVAYHEPSGETRALKLLNAAYSQPEFIRQFRREYEQARALAHPRIVPALDFGEHQGRHYLALKLVPGLDLKARLRSGALPLAAALQIAAQVAEALDYAHGRQLVHRDVKAANVLLDERGEAYLTDFGLLRALEHTQTLAQLSTAGGLAGTAEYMSPEQAQNEAVDARADVYSLSVVVYEMLTGQLPFRGENPLAVLHQHVHAPPPDPRTWRADLPAGVAAAVLGGLAKRAADRPASAGALALALRAALSAEEQAAAEAALRARRQREGAVAVAQARIAAAQRQAAEAQAARRAAEAQAARLEAEAAESERLLVDLAAAEAEAQAAAAAEAQAQREAEARAAAAAQRLAQAERKLQQMETGESSAPATAAGPVDLGWVPVPAGEFLYGDGKEKRSLPAFEIMRAPVTNAQYAEFVRATKQAAPKHWPGGQLPENLAQHPVVQVSWEDAQAFCQWAGCRLPAEEEWEKAARGPSTGSGAGRAYPWGDEAPDAKRCNFNSNVNSTTPVGQYSPQGDSPYGCVDMAGNVWEWTASQYDANQYVVRGGAWYGFGGFMRAVYRGWFASSDRFHDLGFRCAR